MTQSELARAAKLGLSTVVDFGRRRRLVSEEALLALRSALERAGIEFIEENGGGPDVRIKNGAEGRNVLRLSVVTFTSSARKANFSS